MGYRLEYIYGNGKKVFPLLSGLKLLNPPNGVKFLDELIMVKLVLKDFSAALERTI